MRRRVALSCWAGAAVLGLIGYVVWNEPLRYAIANLRPLLLAALFLAACAGFGWAARVPDLLTAAAVGMGILAALVFGAGLAGLLVPVVFVSILLAGVVLCAIAVLQVRPWKTWTMERGFWPAAGWTMLALTIATTLPFVSAPELSTDGLEYHLLIPRLYTEQNSIGYLPLLVESNYPSLAEYIYLPILRLFDDRAAKAFHWLSALLVLATIAGLTRQISAGAVGVLAAALFFTMPVAAITSGWAWNDLIFTLFLLLSLRHLAGGRYLLAGVLFGLATWTKYTFVLASIPFAAVLARGLLQRWWRPADVLRFALPVFGIAAIWATKNTLLTGNPVYPFLNEWFQSPYWGEAEDQYFRGTLTRFEIPEWHWWTFLLFPVLLTLNPRVIDIHTGALPLLLLPLAFLRAGDRNTALLRTYALMMVAGWLLIQTETRSLLSLFAVLSVLYAAAIDRLPSWRIPLSALIGVAVAMNLTIMLISTNIMTDPVRHFIGLETRRQYIERMDEKQKVYRWLDADPRVGGVLLVGLHDPLYLGKPATFSSCCDKPVAQDLVERHGSPENIATALQARGITHVAVSIPEYRRENAEKLYSWSDRQREMFRQFLESHCRSVMRLADVVIFEIRPGGGEGS